MRVESGTYDGILEGLEDLGVDGDLLVAGRDGRDVNCNVPVGLRERIVDLMRKLEYVVLDVTFGLKRGQVHHLDDRLEVIEAVLRLFVSLFSHLNSLVSVSKRFKF